MISCFAYFCFWVPIVKGTTANKELTAGKTLNRKNSIVNKAVYSELSLATKPLAIYSFSFAVSVLVKPFTIYPALEIKEDMPLCILMIAVWKEKNNAVGFVPDSLYSNSTASSISRVRIFEARLKKVPDIRDRMNITAKFAKVFIVVLLPRYNTKIKTFGSIEARLHNT